MQKKSQHNHALLDTVIGNIEENNIQQINEATGIYGETYFTDNKDYTTASRQN